MGGSASGNCIWVKAPSRSPGWESAGKGAGKLRKLGIIGGTSWSSTALYYEHINRAVAQRLGDLHSARLVIDSLDLAPFAEMELSGDWDGVARVSIESAQRLVGAGAEGVIITSNTGHKVYEAVAANIAVPMLHIADATADKLVADGISRVAVLGTRFTMTEPHVRSRLEARGFRRHGSTKSTGSSSRSSPPAGWSATASASSRP